MRATLLGLLLAQMGCGNSKSAPKDAPIPDVADGPPAIDAAVLPPCANPVSGTTVTFRKITGKVIGIATLATSPPDDPRLFVVEAHGRVRIYKDEVLVDKPFIDLSSDTGGPVVYGTELGLLGLAFHLGAALSRHGSTGGVPIT